MTVIPSSAVGSWPWRYRLLLPLISKSKGYHQYGWDDSKHLYNNHHNHNNKDHQHDATATVTAATTDCGAVDCGSLGSNQCHRQHMERRPSSPQRTDVEDNNRRYYHRVSGGGGRSSLNRATSVPTSLASLSHDQRELFLTIRRDLQILYALEDDI